MPRVQVGDIQVSYMVRGEGEPLLLISGFGSNSAGWRPEFVEGLAESFQVITFDNRGTGESDQPDAPYSIAGMADDGVGLLNELGIERAHVVGISMGGMIAQELALRHPERVAGLVLGCTNCGGTDSVSASEEIIQLLAIPPDMDRREAVRRGWPAGFTDEFIAGNEALLWQQAERSLVNPTPLYARDRQMAAIQEWGSGDRLGEVQIPTLVITGDLDQLVPPENSRIIQERIAGSRLEVVEGAAHSFPTSHPEEAVRLMTAFLRAIPVRVAASSEV